MEVGIILGQDEVSKIGTKSEPFAVVTVIVWVVSGPMTSKRGQNLRRVSVTEDVKVAANTQIW